MNINFWGTVYGTKAFLFDELVAENVANYSNYSNYSDPPTTREAWKEHAQEFAAAFSDFKTTTDHILVDDEFVAASYI